MLSIFKNLLGTSEEDGTTQEANSKDTKGLKEERKRKKRKNKYKIPPGHTQQDWDALVASGKNLSV